MLRFTANNRGSSIVEVMTSLLILSIGCIGVARVSYAVIGGNRKTTQVSNALALIQDKQEFFKTQSSIAESLVFTSDDPNPIDASGNAGGIFTREWTVTPIVGSTDVKNIVIRVRWLNQDGSGNDEISLSTVVRL